MRALGVALLVLAAAGCAVDGWQLRGWAQQVPARCASAAGTATAVTCARMPPDELMAHPDDCELFYYCVWPTAAPLCRQCPAGLHFNPALRVCDRPAAAGCLAATATAATAATATAATPAPATESPNLTVAAHDDTINA